MSNNSGGGPNAFVGMFFCVCIAVLFSIFSINKTASVYSEEFFSCKEKISKENELKLSDNCLTYFIDQEINRFSSLNKKELEKEYKEFGKEIKNFSKFNEDIVNNIITSKQLINDVSNKSIAKEISYRYCKHIKDSISNEEEFNKTISICNDYKNKYIND